MTNAKDTSQANTTTTTQTTTTASSDPAYWTVDLVRDFAALLVSLARSGDTLADDYFDDLRTTVYVPGYTLDGDMTGMRAGLWRMSARTAPRGDNYGGGCNASPESAR